MPIKNTEVLSTYKTDHKKTFISNYTEYKSSRKRRRGNRKVESGGNEMNVEKNKVGAITESKSIPRGPLSRCLLNLGTGLVG